MNPDEQLSEHFTLREFITSQTATRRGIKNIPTPAQIESLRLLSVEVLERVRALTGGPLIISSGFRSVELNRAIGGAGESQHCLGEACDFYSPHMTVDALFTLIKDSGIEVDQCISEFASPTGGWVHCSFTRRRANRREFLIATKRHGSTVYRKVQ